MKVRLDRNGLHLFERTSGLNVLLEDIRKGFGLRAADAPRHVSIALTNACDLACAYCYAPKETAWLSSEHLRGWLAELDCHGTLGVGFGGGEPTLYPGFADLCRWSTESTDLAVSFTTHGHRLTREFCSAISGSVHFVRISIDGIGATYEFLRGRPFSELLGPISYVRDIAPFGINVVVNDQTVRQLDEIASFAEGAGACELLLLPQRATRAVAGAGVEVMERLADWIARTEATIRLAMSELESAGSIPLANVFEDRSAVDAYAHIDARGVLKQTSFDDDGVLVRESVIEALDQLRRIGA